MNEKVQKFNFIVYLLSILGPTFMCLVYFYNGCLAHNLYKAFSSKKTYEKRMKLYQVFGFSLFCISAFFSISYSQSNYKENHNVDKIFKFEFFNVNFILIIYLLGMGVIFYIISIVIYIINNFSLLMTDNLIQNQTKKEIFYLFVKKQVTYLIFFIFCYLPNNFVILFQIIFRFEFQKKNLNFISFFVCSSCFVSIVIKLTEPYMKKYFKNLFQLILKKNVQVKSLNLKDFGCVDELIIGRSPIRQRRIKSSSFKIEKKPSFSKISNLEIQEVKLIEMKDLKDKENKNDDNQTISINGCENFQNTDKNTFNPWIDSDQHNRESVVDFSKQPSFANIGFLIYPQDIYLDERVNEIHYLRFKGIFSTLDEEKIYDTNPNYIRKYFNKVPWTETQIYNEFTEFRTFSSQGDDVTFVENIEFKETNKISKLCPFVFNHIRKLDGIKIEDYKESFRPNKNKKNFSENNANGGRSGDSIIFTFDKKYLIKTISEAEKNMLLNILPEYHFRMKERNSFLCRIYGLYGVTLSNEIPEYVIVMRNMNDLPQTLKVCSFDLKGSSVDRSTLSLDERKSINNGLKDEIMKNLGNRVLKDNDFRELEIKINLSQEEKKRITNLIEEDITFLSKNNITDYSILINIHRFNKEEYEKVSSNYRIFKSIDENFIYTFSIIDFITEYDIMKKGEKAVKSVKNLFYDTNFSCQNPSDYYRRMLDYMKSSLFV